MDSRLLSFYIRVRTPIRILWFVAPAVAFWFLQINWQAHTASVTAFVLLGGVFLWTFAEYLLHRFVFHVLPMRVRHKSLEKMHIYHHRVPEDADVINARPVPFLLWSAMLTSLLYFSIGWNLTCLVMFSFTLTYYLYEWIHHLTHFFVFASGPLRFLQEYHLLHHRQWGKNFGQSSPLWDMVFGTYVPCKVNLEPEFQRYVLKWQDFPGDLSAETSVKKIKQA